MELRQAWRGRARRLQGLESTVRRSPLAYGPTFCGGENAEKCIGPTCEAAAKGVKTVGDDMIWYDLRRLKDRNWTFGED